MLEPLADNRARVTTQESIDGWLVERFYSSAELLNGNQLWLLRLKQASESLPPPKLMRRLGIVGVRN
jgi:hypothetical protein